MQYNSASTARNLDYDYRRERREEYRQEPQRQVRPHRAMSRVLTAIAFVAIIGAAIGLVFVKSVIASVQLDINKYESGITEMQQQIRVADEKINEGLNISQIMSRAAALGMSDAGDEQVEEVELPVSSRQANSMKVED